MISLYDLLEAANGQPFGEPGAQLFNDFSFDSRTTTDSNLFVALKSDRGDGHQYIREAVERGATGVLCTRPPDFDVEGVSIILVRDTQVALMKWSHYVLNKLGVQVIGVTGSSGKSITVEAITQVLKTRFAVQRSSADGGGRMSLPQTLARLSPEHKMVVLELGATQPGEMADMISAIQPQVGVVTQVGTAYGDLFENSEHLMQENGLLVEYLSPKGTCILNYDDDRVRSMSTRTRARVLSMGIEGFGADLTAYNVVVGATGTGFDVRFGSNRYIGRWSLLLGKHQLYSILAALAVGIHYDIDPADALKALTNLTPLPGRMNPLNGVGGSLLIDDSYSADPQSTLSALDWLESVTDEQRRAIFVMGDMDGLGNYTQRGHRLVGQRAASFIKTFVTEGPDAALAGRAALDQGMDRRQVVITYSIEDTVARLKNEMQLTSSDIVLIKGGPSARMEFVTSALLANPEDAKQLPRSMFIEQAQPFMAHSRPSWVDIDLNALANNVRQIKTHIGNTVTLFAVVKADAYGHGAVSVARTALLNGAEYLAVASVSEAVELRDAGIEAAILVMSYTPVQAIRQAVRQNITVTLYDIELARAYDRAAREAGGVLRVHVKVDTGMGRLGVLATNAVPFFRSMLNLNHLEVEGIYTHFSMADESVDYTAEQTKTFKRVLTPLRAAGFSFKYVHAANSAGTLASKENHFNAVRVGLAMYGLAPSELVPLPPEFRPVMSWKTTIAQVKTLPKGHAVGYGNTYTAQDDEKVAVIPVGYSDGLRRAPNNWGFVLVHGQLVPIIGRVSMEKTILNVSALPEVAIGDEVVLLGQQGEAVLSADDIAKRIGTINYEVVCGILPRVPRR